LFVFAVRRVYVTATELQSIRKSLAFPLAANYFVL
jgi:hypothetical protein